MIENLLEGPEELIDTPYLQRVWQQGRQEGAVESLRQAILEAIIKRFDPAASQYRQISQQLEQITEQATLQRLLLALFDTADMPTFIALVSDERNNE